MEILKFFVENYVMLFELVGLSIILYISSHLSKELKLYTRIVIILLFVVSVVHHVELWSQGIKHSVYIRHFLTATKYSLYPLILYIFLNMTSRFRALSLKWKLIILIPEFISIILYFSSQWTHLVCYFLEEDNMSYYHGGPLSWLPYIIFILYFIIFIVANVLLLRKTFRQQLVISLFISFGAILCIVLYMVLDSTDNYTPVFTSAIVLYYLFIYIRNANVDNLTGLYNRQTYYQDISLYDSRFCGAISVDMNDLKYFNDKYGHDAGDAAIVKVSQILINYSGENAKVYRIGGDEFIILYTKGSEEVFKNNIDNMKKALEETPYRCAFGYALKIAGGSIDNIIKLADENMYADKKQMKEKKIEQ